MNIFSSVLLEYILLLSIILPFIGTIVVVLFSSSPRFINAFQSMVTLAVFVNIMILISYYINFGPIFLSFSKVLDLPIAFHTEPLGLIFALMASFLWAMTHSYSIGYVKIQNVRSNKELGKDLKFTSFFAFVSLSMAATFGMAFAANLFTMFIFYELLTFATYPLIISSGTKHALKAGRKYLLILGGTSVFFLLPAIIFTKTYTHSIDFTVGGIFTNNVTPMITAVMFAFYVFGIAKTAIIPFHGWLPDAMVAPAPVSALLHAVAVVKSGIFFLIKVIIYIFGVTNLANLSSLGWWVRDWLAILACFTILLSALIAYRQATLKKILAYSTISQLSYCILGASLFSVKSVTASIIHMVAHAFGKIILFFAVGIIYLCTHKTDVMELSGISKKLFSTMIVFLIGALSIIGVPPTIGFISKFMLLDAAWDSNLAVIIIPTILISTLLSVAYFFPIIIKSFYEDEVVLEEDNNNLFYKPDNSMLIPAFLISAFVLTLCFYLSDLMKIIEMIVMV
jgi:multicomponent Na+:H+ antiporter subunit D